MKSFVVREFSSGLVPSRRVRWLRRALCAASLLLLPLGASANSVLVQVGTTNVASGQSVAVTVTADSGTSVAGSYNLRIGYDPDVLKLIHVASANSEYEGFPLNTNDTGIVRMVGQNFDSFDSPTGLVALAEITFLAIGPAGTDSALTIDVEEFVDADTLPLDPTVVNGMVHVLSPPVATFDASPTEGLAPLPVTFNDFSTGTITNRFWDFGDGSTTNTTATTIQHTYTSDGTFTVSLTVSGPDGSSTTTVPDLITATVLPPELVVAPASHNFGLVIVGQTSTVPFQVINTGGSPLNGSATVGAPFAVLSGSPFGVPPGQTGTVTVAFMPVSAGDFNGAVTFASNGGGSTNPVAGQSAIVPGANFTGSPTNGLAPLMVTFSDSSTGTITNRFWNFGDGATTNTLSTSVVHTYAAAGTNTVTLIVSGPAGADLLTRNHYIVVTNRPAQLVVSPASRNFGQVALGETNTLPFSVVNPGDLTLDGTATVGGPFSIASGSPFVVGGGQTSTVNVSFVPTSAAAFSNAVVFSSNGGSSTNPVTGQGALDVAANFTGDPTNGPTPLVVTFSDSSTGTITNRFWNFGDGATTNTSATTVVHTYPTAGTNTVTLIVTGPLGSSTNIRPAYIVATVPDTNAPTLAIHSPTPNQVFTNAVIPVSGTASDPSGIKSVTVNGLAVIGSLTNWSQSVTLDDGTNLITVIAVDDSPNMNAATQTVHAVFSTGGGQVGGNVAIRITEPADQTETSARFVDVLGDGEGFTSVIVTNNRGGPVHADLVGTNWTASNVALRLGTNQLFAVASDGTNTASEVIAVVRVNTNYVNTTLRASKASVARGAEPNTDSISVLGVFNDFGIEFNPSNDVVEVIFGDYEAMLPPNSLKKLKFKGAVSESNTLTAVAFNAKKRSFSFAAATITLTNTNPFVVALALGENDLGPDSISFPVDPDGPGKFAWTFGPQMPDVDQFFLGKSKLATNSFALTGNLNVAAKPDVLTNPVSIGIGAWDETLPTEGWTKAAGNVYNYVRPSGHPGKVTTMMINFDLGTWRAVASGVDLGFLLDDPNTDVRLEVAEFAASYPAKLIQKKIKFGY